MKVNFITEYGADIGYGHLMRCLSLSQAFEARGIDPMFVLHTEEPVPDILTGRQSQIVDWHKDPGKLREAIAGSDITLVDSYLADTGVYESIAASSEYAVYMDDGNRRHFPKGMVVNGAIAADEIDYPKKPGLHYLLGPRYIALRAAFRTVPLKEIKTDVDHVMITFGGGDFRNLTPKLLRAVSECYPDWRKTVVVGKDFRNVDDIEAACDHNTKPVFSPDAEGMKTAMLSADIVVSAGGQTLYECARVGVPVIGVAVAGNQGANVRGGQQAGLLESASSWKRDDWADAVLGKIELLRDRQCRLNMSRQGREAVDGAGAERIVRECLKSYFTELLVFRKARHNDLMDVFALSNDPMVRAASFHPDPIGLASHRSWYGDRLRDPHCLFYVAEAGSDLVGQVRFDLKDPVAVVSISIHQIGRGCGVGAWLLNKGIDSLKRGRPEVDTVLAHIKGENKGSTRFFERFGFEYVQETTVSKQKAKTYAVRLRQGA
ncbi:MAG: GNAT family N-acetyltransferase [Nitrospiria bacterium]